MKDFFKNMQDFAVRLIKDLESHNLLEDIKEIDHVCYRVETQKQFVDMSQVMGQQGVLLSEALVSGRPIATFKCYESTPLIKGFSVQVLEIPSPKPGRFYPEGFEHIEAVVNCSLEAFMKKHVHLGFSTDNYAAKINRDISLKFQNGVVKFHEQSLEKVIEAEK